MALEDILLFFAAGIGDGAFKLGIHTIVGLFGAFFFAWLERINFDDFGWARLFDVECAWLGNLDGAGILLTPELYP